MEQSGNYVDVHANDDRYFGVSKSSFENERNTVSKLMKKMSIKFSKEFFVTEKGDVVKMAAIITQDKTILANLEQ